MQRIFRSLYLLLLLCVVPVTASEDPLIFDDAPLQEPLNHPDWFKNSFLDLRQDLKEAFSSNKKGLVVYFGQSHCAYCKALLEVNFSLPDIAHYTQTHFDIVPINIWSIESVVDPKGETLTGHDYAVREGTNFTPSLIFYNENGDKILRLRGYYPPYKFRAALEYVADSHYKTESFRDYLDRADPTRSFEPGGLNEEDFLPTIETSGRHLSLDKNKPTAVFFEQGNCHACDVLHTEPLSNEIIQKKLLGLNTVQLDVRSKTIITKPDGEEASVQQWAKQLNLFHYPSIVFFDLNGEEIIRVDSVVQFLRLHGVLDFVLTEGYLKHKTYQLWRNANRMLRPSNDKQGL